jgi:glycosyltransferase involved in cell wall biosynthesis
MDAFYAAVEERLRPELRGRPIVVGADPRGGAGRGVVTAASYAARKYGIRSALPISRAWRLAETARRRGEPEVVFVRDNRVAYREASGRIMALIAEGADAFEEASIDEAYVDLSSLGDLPGATRHARALKARILEREGLTCSVGIGPNKLVAKIAADFQKPDGLTVVAPDAVAAFLAPLPIRASRPRIRSIRQDNIGERAARARGILLTRAPMIVFLDADDRLYPDALARYVSFLDKHAAAGVAYGERTLINEAGDPFDSGWRAVLNKHPQGDVLESILRRPFLSTPSQACLRREAVPPAEWLGDRGPGGDWILLTGAALGSQFAYMGKSPLVEYRIRRGSMLRSVASDPHTAAEICVTLYSIPLVSRGWRL